MLSIWTSLKFCHLVKTYGVIQGIIVTDHFHLGKTMAEIKFENYDDLARV